jgi:hypothetical protein
MLFLMLRQIPVLCRERARCTTFNDDDDDDDEKEICTDDDHWYSAHFISNR